MKKILMSSVATFLFCITLCAQNPGAIHLLVLDENEDPMEFATVAVLSLPDSTVLCGGVTDAVGLYETALPEKASLVQVSMIGYHTAGLPVSEFSGIRTVRLVPDNLMLEGAAVSATLPKTEIKGDAVVTNITGSVLEHTGNALDVLAKVPGMINRNGSLEVIGRGAPLFYINGRRVTDDSELRNLMSEDIKAVEVVSNPGALYGGDVSCVVRIRTVKRQGEGFSFALTSQARQHIYTCKDFEPSWSVLDLNYRVKGWDFFGKVVYWNQRNYQISDLDASTYIQRTDGGHRFRENGSLDYRGHYGGMQFLGGANWQINENHSLGFKINRDQGLFGSSRLIVDAGTFLDDAQEDQLYTINDAKIPTNNQWSGNLYYDGNIGDLNINFNADFLSGRNDTATEMKESSWISPAELSSEQKSSTFLGAGKMVLSYPVWKGKLQIGVEEIYVSAGQTYEITFAGIPSTDAALTENNIAGFAEYAATLPFGQLSAGLRFEHDNFSYSDHLHSGNSLEKVYNNWFPSFSFATKAGPVGLSLSFSGKTRRPDFNRMSSEMTYNNRFNYQSGNPLLLSEKHLTGSLNANWKWLTLSGNYERIDNFFVQWATPYNDEGVVLLKSDNLDTPLRKMSFYLTGAPTVGVWNPRFTVGMDKQFLTLTLDDPTAEGGHRTASFNRAMYVVQLDNSFRFKHSWLLEAGYQYISKLNQANVETCRPIQNASLSIQKSFLKDDALTFRLTWSDIFNSSVEYARVDFGRYIVNQSSDNYNPSIILRISYRFNSASSKYKGTGAGDSAKSRL